MTDQETRRVIAERIRQLGSWLEDRAPYVQHDQRHLDGGSPEQAYWHLGYRSCLLDVMAFIENLDGHRQDTTSRSPPADPDA
jgi:hypothetical protein